MARSAMNKTSKAIKAIGDPKVNDALYSINTLIGNVQHECVKGMTESIAEVANEKVTHLAVSVRNSLEDHKTFVDRIHKENDERMTMAMIDVESHFLNHAALINTVQSRTAKLVDIKPVVNQTTRLVFECGPDVSTPIEL